MFGHRAVLLGSFAELDATWRWDPPVSPSLSSFSLPLPLLSPVPVGTRSPRPRPSLPGAAEGPPPSGSTACSPSSPRTQQGDAGDAAALTGSTRHGTARHGTQRGERAERRRPRQAPPTWHPRRSHSARRHDGLRPSRPPPPRAPPGALAREGEEEGRASTG